MAALTEDQLVERVMEGLGRITTGDAQLSAATVKRKADDVYRRLRRRLSAEFPSLYEAISSTTTLTSTSTIAKPADCEAIRVVERQSGSDWYPLQVAPSLNRDEVISLSFYEIGANIQIVPTSSAAGSYRIIYVAKPATVITTYDVPDGIEGIIVEETCAWARQRHNELEYVRYHLDQARQIWKDSYMGLWKRYGSHGTGGINVTRR